jgi:hypothetical protein
MFDTKVLMYEGNRSAAVERDQYYRKHHYRTLAKLIKKG